jgi:hypothetical protein
MMSQIIPKELAPEQAKNTSVSGKSSGVQDKAIFSITSTLSEFHPTPEELRAIKYYLTLLENDKAKHSVDKPTFQASPPRGDKQQA